MTRRCSRVPIVVWLLVLVPHVPGRADVLWRTGQAEPQYGRVRQLEGDKLGFREWDPELQQLGPEQELERQAVEDWLVNIDEFRLQNRTPHHAAADLAHAEELAAQRQDPVAAQLARRLYLLAAVEGGPDLCRQALMGLRSLTTDPRRQQAIDFRLRLLRPENRAWEPPVDPGPEVRWTEVEGQLMLRLVRALRQGDRATAMAMLQAEQNRSWLNRWESRCSQLQLLQMARQENLAPEQLQLLLEIELWIETGNPTETSAGQPGRAWLDLAREEVARDAIWPAWDTLSEFDPRANRFRDGRWQAAPAME